MTRVEKVARKRDEVYGPLTPRQQEMYVCFAGAVSSIYSAPLMPDALVALKAYVSVLEVYCENPGGDGKEEHY